MERQLGAFAVQLWWRGANVRRQGNAYQTICTKLATVRWFHRHDLGYDPPVDAGHALLMRGIRRFSNPVRKRLPLTPHMLRCIFNRCTLTAPRDQLLWGGLALAYFFLLRRSEYLCDGARTKTYVLRLGDITKGNRADARARAWSASD